MTEEQFVEAIRTKYPDAYQDLDDETLKAAFLKKHPIYRNDIEGYAPADPFKEELKEPTREFNPDDYRYEAPVESLGTMVDQYLTPKKQPLNPELFKRNKMQILNSSGETQELGVVKMNKDGSRFIIDSSKVLDTLSTSDELLSSGSLDEESYNQLLETLNDKRKLIQDGYRIYNITTGEYDKSTPNIYEDSIGDEWIRGLKYNIRAYGEAVNATPDLIKNYIRYKMGPTGVASSVVKSWFDQPDMVDKLIPSDLVEPLFKEVSDNIIAYSESIEAAPATGIYAKDPESVFGYADPRRVWMILGENGLLMGSFMAATYVSPTAGTALMLAVEAGSAKSSILDYEKRTGKTVPKIYRDNIPIIVGALNASLERLGIDQIIKGVPGVKSKMLKVLIGTLIEGGTEGVQEINQMIAEKIGQDKDLFSEENWDQLKESVYAGLVLGSAGTTITSGTGLVDRISQSKFDKTKVGQEILKSRKEGKFDETTLDMAERFAKKNPEAFEERSILQFTDEVRTITSEELRGNGWSEEQIKDFWLGEGVDADTERGQVRGSTLLDENGSVLINLYRGATPSTVVEEFYGNHFRRLSDADKKLWADYYQEFLDNGGRLTEQEYFEKEGKKYYFDESLYKDNPISKLLRRVKFFFKDYLGNSSIKPEIRAMYEKASEVKVDEAKAEGDVESFEIKGVKKEINVERGERKSINPKTLKLSTLESKKITDAISGTNVKAGTVKEKIQNYKANHPVSDGWEKIEANKVTVDDKGNIKVEYKPVPYSFQQYKGKTPVKGSTAYKRLVTKLGRNAVKDLVVLAERARDGDKNAQAIIEQATWYRELKSDIHQQFGGQTDLFGELLGATSPQTAVAGNFQQALEALEIFNKGGYDKIIQDYVKYLDKGGVPSKYTGEVPVKKNGAKYGANSKAVLDVLTANWIQIKPGASPKAKNFALNILGKSDFATIDVWSARAWQRRAGGKRIPPQAETGVTGIYSADGKSITGQFGVGGDAYDYTIEKLKELGLDEYLDASAVDLQAIDWFLEKEIWTENNWTTKEGEGGSFEDQLKMETIPKSRGGGEVERNFDRTQIGSSIQQFEGEPTSEEIEAVRTRIEDIVNKDDKVRAVRYEDSKGLYTYLDDSGAVVPDQERSFDTELTVERGYIPTELYQEIIKISQENNQLDTFFSRVLKDGEENHPNARPGIEVTFAKPLTEEELSSVIDAIREKGLELSDDKISAFDGFTLSREQRTKKGEYTGVRLQIIPEIRARYDMKFRERIKDSSELEKFIQKAEDGLLDLQVELEQRNDVENTYNYKYITKVVGKENYDTYLQANTSEGNREIWEGSSLREEVSNTIQGYEESAGRQDTGGNESQEVTSPDSPVREGESFEITPDKTPLDIDSESKVQQLKNWLNIKFIDELGRLKQIQDKVEKLPEEQDAYMYFQNMVGRASSRNDKAADLIWKGKDSILNRLKKELGFNIDDLGEYLYARHSKERTKAVQGRGSKKGSGMDTKTANAILKKYRGTGIDKYAKEFYKEVTKKALDLKLEAGLIDKEQYDDLKGFYKNYVPLKGTAGRDEYSFDMGKGFSVSTTGIYFAEGRESVAENPAAQAIIDLQSAIVLSEKNRAMQSLYKFLEANPHSSWSVSGRRLYPIKGALDETGEPILRKKNLDVNQAAVYFDGKQKVITIKDKDLNEAIKKLGATGANRYLQMYQTYFRAINTQLSPSFIVTNFERDLQTALVHLGSQAGSKVAYKVSKDIGKALKGIWGNLKGKETEWSKLYQEYQDLGGKVGWMDFKTLDEKTEQIHRSINRYNKAGNIKESLFQVGQFISDVNETVENGVRLSTYKHLLDSGMSKDKAIQFSKDLTVNFNRKGRYGSFINSLWAFSNAGIQGTNRIYRALTHKNPKIRKKAQKIVTGIVGTGFTMSMLNRWTDEDEWENMSTYNKTNNLLWMIPGREGEKKKSVAIKLPYGYNFFYALGQTMEEVMYGDVTKQEGFYRLLSSASGAFSPISGGSAAEFLSPTISDPIVQIATNKNFMGGPIAKISPYGPRKPRSQEYFSSVRSTSKEFTTWLNTFGGGSKTKQGASGWLDWNPEYLDALYDSYSGGVGKFVGNTFNLGYDLLKGEVPETQNIPLVRQFLKESSDWQARTLVYDMFDESKRVKFDKDQVERFLRNTRHAAKRGSITYRKASELRKKFRANQRKVK